jgi:hypothetical protein
VATMATFSVRSRSIVLELVSRNRCGCAIQPTGANGCERLPRIDKLGVTGSSPVPPMIYPAKRLFALSV